MTRGTDRSLGGVRREHRAFKTDVSDLRRLAAHAPAEGLAHGELERALDRFLAEWGPRLNAHLDVEERLVTPGVIHALPSETWTEDTFRRERETFETLLDLLRDGRAWLERQEPGAEREIVAALDDLSSFWGQHVRRVDVIGPAISSLEDPGHA